MTLTVLITIAIAVVIYIVVKSRNTSAPNHEPQNASPLVTEEISTPNIKYLFEPNTEMMKYLRAMVYIGKADGQLREEEIKIMVNFFIHQQTEHMDSDSEYMCRCIRDIKPFSTAEYNNFVRNLDTDNLKALLVYYTRITGTQKKNHPFEDHLLFEIEELIKAREVSA